MPLERLRIEPADVLRDVLQIAIHHDDKAAAAMIETGRDGIVLAEISG